MDHTVAQPAEEEVKEEEQNESEPEEKKAHLSSTDGSDNGGQAAAPVVVPDAARWYIIHTYAGHENKVARSLQQRVEAMGFIDRIFDIIVPTRNTIKVAQGKKETVKEKIFPGYVLVRMVLDDESWFMVRSTQGVTSFIGAGNKPTPISEKEVEAIKKFMNMEEPLYKVSFAVGEAVKITDGPFSEFLGTIDSIDETRGKLRVLVSIFGRETPVELDFLQVKKI
jgi:transcriptional antiterminator NusG